MSAADEYGVEAAPAELRYTFALSPFIPADSVVVMKERETYRVIAHDELSDAQILDAIAMFCQKELESPATTIDEFELADDWSMRASLDTFRYLWTVDDDALADAMRVTPPHNWLGTDLPTA